MNCTKWREIMTNSLDITSEIHSYGIDIKNREIFLHGHVGNTDEDPGVEYRMAANFYKNIRILDSQSSKPILIHMYSDGGEWDAGMAIFDAIRVCKSFVTIIAYGAATSMSSIILQAADKRVMMPRAYFLLHYGTSGFTCDYLSSQKHAKAEKKNTETMIDIYANGCIKGKYFKESIKNLTLEKIKTNIKRKLKDGDWILDANEAVYYGFADSVLDTRKLENIESLK